MTSIPVMRASVLVLNAVVKDTGRVSLGVMSIFVPSTVNWYAS